MAIIHYHGCIIQFSSDNLLCVFFLINLIRVEESHKGGSSSRLLSSLNAGEANISD